MKTATVVHGPPGTGKSFTLVRICGEYLDSGARVCLLSHTKAAAAELSSRLKGRSGVLHTSTIHSMVYGMVDVTRMQVVDRDKLVEFGNMIGVPISGNFDINGEQEREITDGDEALAIIGRADARMVSHMDEFDISNRPLPQETFRYVSSSYIKWKAETDKIDFTDMLLRYIADPRQILFDVLIIDEAQDLSRAQWCVIEAMQEYVQHIVVAGDSDQQLFSWGGSDTHGMKSFAERTNANVYSLPTSYRIPQSVHSVAMKVRERVVDREDIKYAPRDVAGLVETHVSPVGITFDKRDTLILYRTHSLRRELEQELLDSCTPYRVLNGFKDPWSSAFGSTVKVFGMAARGEHITPRQQRLLDRYCSVTQVTSAMRWENHMLFPDRFIEYMLNTEGMEPTVRMSTIHGAKGMEAARVILYTGLTQRVQDGMNELPDAEHRVFYVGVTRAKEQLDIVSGDLNYDI